MPADIEIRFTAKTAQAQRDVAQLQREVGRFRQGLDETERTATDAAKSIDSIGKSAQDLIRQMRNADKPFYNIAPDKRRIEDSFATAVQAVKTLTDEITTARVAIDDLNPTLEASRLALAGDAGLTGLMRSAALSATALAAGIEGVQEPFTQFTVTLADARAEERLLAQASQSLIHELNVLERLASPFEILHEDINLVNPAIREAVESLQEYNRTLAESETEYRSVEQISESLTDSIREQASAYDALRASVAGVSAEQSGLQGQQLSSDIFDQFNPQTPGGGRFQSNFSDALGQRGLQLGTALVGQGLRSAGDIRRAEEQRVASLEELEARYSQRVVEINEDKARRLAEVSRRIEFEDARRLETIRAAFSEAAAAEAVARENAASEIQRIEERAAATRERLRERLTDRLLSLETRLEERIASLGDGLAERERERQAERVAIVQRAAAAREAVEERYAERVQAINNRLVEDVRRLQERLRADLERLDTGFAAREQGRADEIQSIRQELVTAETEYAAEVANIHSELAADIQGVHANLTDELATLDAGFVERERERATRTTEIAQDAAAARLTAENRHREMLVGIYRDLVDAYDDLQDDLIARTEARAEERVAIETRTVAERLAAEAAYTERVQEISTELVETVREIESEVVRVTREATEERLEIEENALTRRAEANESYTETLASIENDRDRRLQEIAETREQRLQDIQETAARDRERADLRYADRFQDIQNDLVERVVGIQRDLNDRLNALRDEALTVEQDRQQRLLDLHAQTQDRLADLERGGVRTREDLERRFQDDLADIIRQRAETLQGLVGADPEEAAEIQFRADERAIQRREQLIREHQRTLRDLAIREQRAREDIQRSVADREAEIRADAAARLAGISEREGLARQRATAGIGAAEAAAGVTFQEAQANYVPALSAHEAALLAHTEALESIAAQQETATGDTLSESLDAAAAVADDFSTALDRAKTELASTLSEITESTQAALGGISTGERSELAALADARAGAEASAGLTFAEALEHYTLEIGQHNQAINTLNDTLVAIDERQASALAGIGAAESEDIRATAAAEALLESQAGVSIGEARANYIPALSRAAEATDTLNATMQSIDASLRATLTEIASQGRVDRQTTDTRAEAARIAAANRAETLETQASAAVIAAQAALAEFTRQSQAEIAGIQGAGVTDRQETDAARAAAIAAVAAQQALLESEAGTTYAEALAAFQPRLSGIAQADLDRQTALQGIDATEVSDLSGVTAESLADRLTTDAAITAERDAYIKARDIEIFNHNTAIRQLGIQEAADIATIKTTLQTNLVNIDRDLDAQLAEIRDTKAVFDTRMNEMIEAINAEANQDVASLREDTASMQAELEAIAQEARDNAWKRAMLKVANVGVTIAGVAAGAYLGNPAAGFQVGAALGGLIEQGGNELFHYEQTDAIARRIARTAGSRRSRPAPDYLPTPDQLRNARDVGREVVAGFTEGLRSGNPAPQQPIEIRIEPNDIVLNDEVIGAVVDRMLVRLDAEGRTFGSYLPQTT